ncbi:uncharacterized protein BO88DRAFT_447360 [Aspergillus vadensis CBS 113365]|uniref:Uncharacterized protein n=1 Tax=Aspergillus vadensis (strain CBS 113365 / IMI 142717 / IBT 24658) TaxID=1448311 RepID=A0A319AU54_ASPVC|nr:hypothetical protein BO88DRAFT_447360 [Aspergillus vadensis CBS 113365]PYH63867.1 hypothetical protein BO88DRAFT_447360 [Aspergillus vadensis CBS 113365]
MPYWATAISGPQLCSRIGCDGYTGLPADLDLLNTSTGQIANNPKQVTPSQSKSLTAGSKMPIVRTDHENADHPSRQDLSPFASRPVRDSTTAAAAHPNQGDEVKSDVDGQIRGRAPQPASHQTTWPGSHASVVLCTRVSSAKVGMGQESGDTAMVGGAKQTNDGRERNAPVQCIADRRLHDNIRSLDQAMS